MSGLNFSQPPVHLADPNSPGSITDLRIAGPHVLSITFPNQAQRDRWWALINDIMQRMAHLLTTDLPNQSLSTKRSGLRSWFALVTTLRKEFGVAAVPQDIRQACNDNEDFCDLPRTSWDD